MELDVVLAVSLVFSCSCLPLLASVDSIKFGKSITGDQKMVSVGGSFVLGFLTPGNSTFTYLGIWYNTIPEQTAIWIANRESPVPQNSTAVFTIGDDGNFVILDEKGKLLWSSNVSSAVGKASNSTVGALLDNGNLVLMHGESNVLWQSFEHPSDTFMPEMKIGYNRKTGQRTLITSWRSSEDPRPGNFSFGISPEGRPTFYVWEHNSTYFRFDDPSEYGGGNLLGGAWFISVVSGNDGTFVTYGYTKGLITLRFLLTPTGYAQLLVWIQNATNWNVLVQAPQAPCETYSHCGPFGSCGIRSGACICLTGFEPRFSKDWANGKWNGGCVRKIALGCDGGDGFLKHDEMKLPDHPISLGKMSIKDCETQCIRNCSCAAYAYSNSTCLIWSGDLLDVSHNLTYGRALYIRVHGSEPITHGKSGISVRKHRNFIARIVSAIVAILVLICIFAFIFKRKNLRRRVGWKDKTSALIRTVSSLYPVGKSDMKLVEYSLQKIRDATNNFHEDNKLGEGGFGPVFKGFLAEFGDVAIKRLSKKSSQGLEEFLNELKLIAKLQHKNLVSLLGCCVEREEKILIYEYMCNCSLDNFLFDNSMKVRLDWSKRLAIIEGIAQGMLYLHKYSRLKVIHRDLKVSNILLDEDMIPKISDFGMARIFGTDQTQDSTNRVVGTYGYMPPEYVVYGQFSEKSDVFSFGVLLLEILSGERNSDFFKTGICASLLGWAYNQWKEGRIIEMVDPSIRETCDHNKATRFVLVSLLCVQEIPTDRPTMSEIVVMLSNEALPIPEAKEPAFRSSGQSQQSIDFSTNESTFSLPKPR